MPGAERPPVEGAVTSDVIIPAMEAMLITRLGESGVVPLRRRLWRPTVAFQDVRKENRV